MFRRATPARRAAAEALAAFGRLPLGPPTRLPTGLDVLGQFPRRLPVYLESVTRLVSPNGGGGPRTHDAVDRSGTVAEPVEPRLDVGDDKRIKSRRGARLTRCEPRIRVPKGLSQIDLTLVREEPRQAPHGAADDDPRHDTQTGDGAQDRAARGHKPGAAQRAVRGGGAAGGEQECQSNKRCGGAKHRRELPLYVVERGV